MGVISGLKFFEIRLSNLSSSRKFENLTNLSAQGSLEMQ